MVWADALAGVVLLGVVAYALLGGADFGGGVWDLLARGPRKGAQRAAIAHAMGPVWEANHVWLIFVITLLFTGWPSAYAALSVALFLPFHLVLLGIILRGAAFVFRAYGPDLGPAPRRWGGVFGVASLLTPFVLGMSMAAISQGLVWFSPFSLSVGLLAVAVSAYLAGVYLTVETTGALREDFRRRALGAWAAVALLAAFTLLLMRGGAPHLWAAFTSARGLPLLLGGGAAAAAGLWALWARRFLVARVAAAAEVALLLLGWGLLQHPYLVYPDATISGAAAPEGVLVLTLAAVGVGTLLLVPSLAFLFRVFKGQQPGVAPHPEAREDAE